MKKYSDIVGRQTLEIMAQAVNYNCWLYGMIKPWIKDPVAEAGAGTGIFSGLLSVDHSSVTAIDFNSEYLDKAKNLSPNITTVKFDLQSKRIPPSLQNKFQTVVTLNVLEHISDHLQALINLRQMLKVGGKLIVLVPAGNWAYGSLDLHLGHVRRYEIDPLQQLVNQAGFKVIFQRYLNILGLIGWFVNGKLEKRKILPGWQLKIFDIISQPLLWLETKIRFPFGLSILTLTQKV